MSSIEQPASGPVTGSSPSTLTPVDYPDTRVKRGYDPRNSQSRVSQAVEARPQASHRLEQPALAALASSAGFDSALTDLTRLDPGAVKALEGQGLASVRDSAQMMQGMRHLEATLGEKPDPGKLGEMMKMVFSPEPASTEGDPWQWAESRLGTTELKMLEQSLGRSGTFSLADATIQINALSSGPAQLVADIKSDYQKIARAMMSDSLWDTDMLATMLSSIQQKMQDNRLQFDQETIRIGQVEKERLSNKIISDIKDSIESTNKAKESNLVSKIFGYIGLAVMAVVTVMAFATGVGAVAGTLMVASLAIMIAMTVDQETGGHGMKALTKGIMEAFGVDEEQATYIASGVMMAIMIALSLGAGASGAAASGASRMAVLASRTGMVASGGAAVGEGGAKIAAGVYTYEASMLQADAKETKALMMRLQQMIEDATESLQMALEDLQAGHSRIAAIVSNNDETKKGIMRNFK